MAHNIERDNVLGERVGSGFYREHDREFDAEEGLADRWRCSAVVRSNGSVEVVPVYGYRTDEIGRVEVFCCGEECEWRDEHWFHQYVVAVAMGVLS